MSTTKAELIGFLIENLRDSVRREGGLDTDKTCVAIEGFLEKLNDLPPDWQGVRDHLQNAVLECKLFDREDDVQLTVNSDPSEYVITATLYISATIGIVKDGGDTAEIALKRLRAKLDRMFKQERERA